VSELDPLDDVVAQLVCPLCRVPVLYAQGSSACPRCALDVTDARAIELHRINMRIGVDSARRQELEAELRAVLGLVLPPTPTTSTGWPSDNRFVASGPVPSWPSASAPATGPREVSEVSARNVILGVGVALLGVALAVFVAVTWPRLDPSGRVGFLVVATAIVVGATSFAAQRKLASTVEALASLTVILLLANSYAIRQGWFLESDRLVYWAAAIAIVVACCVLFNTIIRTKALTIAALVGAQLPALLAVASFAEQGSYLGFVLVVQALLTATFGRKQNDFVASFCEGLSWLVFVVGFIASYSYLVDTADASAAQIALSAAVALAAAGLALQQRQEQKAVLAWSAATISVVLTVFAITRQTFDGSVQIAVGAAALLLAVAVWSLTRGAMRRGALGVLSAVNAAFVLSIVPIVLTVAVLPFSWVNFVWQLQSRAIARDHVGVSTVSCFGGLTACPEPNEITYESWGANAWHVVALALLVVSAALLFAGIKRYNERNIVLFVGGGSALWLGVIALGASHIATMFLLALIVLVILALSFALNSQGQLLTIFGAALALANVVAWSLAAESTSVLVIPTAAVGLFVLGVVAVVQERDNASSALAAMCIAMLGGSVAVVGGINDWEWSTIGVALGVLYALIYAVSLVALGNGRLVRLGLAVQASAAAGFFVGLAQQDDAASTSLMLAVASALALASALRRRDLAYWAGTAVLGLASLWAALVDQSIGMIQAYTVPVAIVLLVFGHLVQRDANASSWSRYGFGVIALVGPALYEALVTEQLGYLGWATAVALGALLVGVALRYQAPLTVGAVGLLAVAVRLLGPYADEIPRWLVLGVPGLLLILVGATWEHRRADVNKLVAAYQKLG